MKLTNDEKAVVARYLGSDPSWRGVLAAYWPFLAPSLIAGIYGVYDQNYIACSIGFILLACFVMWFFYHGGKEGIYLRSALEKYEQEVSALGE